MDKTMPTGIILCVFLSELCAFARNIVSRKGAKGMVQPVISR
jgi:hypothetical protein